MQGEGKIALVSGANKGIGYEIAKGLAQKGCTVLLGARNKDLGQAAAEALQKFGKVQWLELDITSDKSVESAAAHIKQHFSHLDILVNNAAISSAPGSSAGSTHPKDAAVLFEVNVFSVMRMLNAFLPLVKAASQGRVVTVSSEVGSFGIGDNYNQVRQYAMTYAASKSALNAILIGYYMNLEKDSTVKMNAVCPGYCATDLNGHQGHRSTEQGAQIAIKFSLLPNDGPSGGFYNDAGEMPW